MDFPLNIPLHVGSPALNKYSFSATLRFAIQNFVFPSQRFKIGRQMEGEPRLRFTLGIHPHALAKNRPQDGISKTEKETG